MRPRGSYKIANRGRALGARTFAGRAFPERGIEDLLDPLSRSEMRSQRILRSLRDEILLGGGAQSLRIRQVFRTPREIFRLELELPELGYQRTTLLDRDALEELLGAEDVRQAVEGCDLGA